MTTTFRRCTLLALSCMVSLGLPWARTVAAEASGIGRQARPNPTQTSVYFEPNVGQADSKVRFVGRAARYSMLLESQAMTLVETPPAGTDSNNVLDVMRLEFSGCEKDSEVFPSGRLPGKSNYFIGDDANRWHAGVAHYTRVDISEIYPGIAASYYGTGGNVEYDLRIAPGVDPALIRIQVSGARRVELNSAGDLVIKVTNGEIRYNRPIAYQFRNGVRSNVAATYKLLGEHKCGFEIGPYDHQLPLLIDPVIVYSTYLGGPAQGIGAAIAVDGSGSAYVTGETYSVAFPLRNPIYPTAHGDLDITVSKFDPSGSTLVYSTYLGSSSFDLSRSIAVDAAGNAYVTGVAGGSNFPTFQAFQPSFGGNIDAFVTKLNPSGSSLVFSTFLGGNNLDEGEGIAVDTVGNVFVTGRTNSPNFSVANAYQGTFHGPGIATDAFLTKLDSSGASVQFSTFFGGSSDDEAKSIVLDALGGAWIGGSTASSDLPVRNAF
jgi:Beta-propeller repeat